VRVLVAGASGAVGRPLVRELLAAGHEVIGMTRSRADAIRELGAEPVEADALDSEAVLRAVEHARPDVVVNQLTDLNRPLNPRKYADWLESTNRLRREGTRNLVEAARAVNARRVVSQSVAFMYGFDPGLKDEDSPLLGQADAGAMAAGVGAIHELERQTLDAPGGVVLRYGFFYGPGTGYARDGQQIEAVRKRQMPVVGGGAGKFPFIHVDDAASATAAAVGGGTRGIYNIVDDEPAPMSDWVPYVAELVGAKRPMKVPAFVARIAAGKPITQFATRLQPVSNAKAKRELGWQPRYPSWREGFKAELA
jgi:nucleoside-diphosphate-sugar epimerase